MFEFQEIAREDYLTLLERRFTALAGRMRQEYNAEIQLTDICPEVLLLRRVNLWWMVRGEGNWFVAEG